MAKCPNKSHPDWKALVDIMGETEAMAVFMRNGDEIPDMSNLPKNAQAIRERFPKKSALSEEEQQTFQRMKSALSGSLNAEVILDSNLEGAGQLETGNETPTIRVNPNYMRGDTLIHEYGHLFIDLLGGMNNSMIRQGRKYLNGTNLEESVTTNYPELSGDKLDKEILATAIGKEGEQIWENQGTVYGRFKNWLNLFLSRLKKAIGLQHNVALELANKLLTNQISEQLQTELAQDVQQQKVEDSPLQRKADIIRERKNLMSKIKQGIETKLGRYTRILNSTRTTERQRDNINQLKKLVEQFGEKDDAESLMGYIETGLRETSMMLSRLQDYQSGEIKMTSRDLKNIHDYLQAYSHAEEIRDLLEDDADLHGKLRENTLSDSDKKTMVDALNQVVVNHSRIQSKYRRLAKIHLANEFAKRDGKVHGEYRERYRKEFDNQNGKRRSFTGSTTYKVNGKEVSKKEYKQARSEYVNEKMADNKAEIVEKERTHFIELFDLGPTDLGMFEAYILDPANINSDLIQVAHEMLERADFRAMQDSIEKFKDADDLMREFEQEHSELSQKEKYDDLIEDEVDENGNKTGEKSSYMVGRYYSKPYEINREFHDKKDAAREAGNEEKLKELEDEHSAWLTANTTRVGRDQFVLNEKWKNPQYEALQQMDDSNPTKKVYDHLIELREETDSRYPNASKLNKRGWGETFYKLPSVNASNLERVADNGFLGAIRQTIKDKFNVRSDETDYRPEQVEEEGSQEEAVAEESKRIVKAMGDESGGLNQTIPVYFRGNMDKSDQSYDLMSIHLLDNSMGVNYTEKSKIHADIEMIKDLSATRDVQKTKGTFAKGISKMVNAFTGEDEGPIVEQGDTTKAHKALVSLIESRLYGIQKLGDKTINKWADNILSWTGDVMLIGNYLSASANLLQGKTQNWIESLGATDFSTSDLVTAEKKYWNDYMAWSQDFGRRRFYSKTNLLMEKFNSLGDWSAVAERFIEDTRLKNKLKKSTLHGLNNLAEHYVQNTAMYAVLNNIKVKDKDGNFLKRDDSGKIITTDSVEEAMSLDEAYEVKDARLVLNDRVASTTNTLPGEKGGKVGNEEIESISFLIRDINADLQGQYDSRQKSLAGRTVAGRSAEMLRRWLPRGWMRRFRGISRARVPKDDLRKEERFYSRSRQDFKSGIYTDFFRLTMSKEYIDTLRKEGVKASFDLLKQNWEDMSDQEYANVRRAVGEFAVASLTLVSAALIKGLADEEEDEYQQNALFYMAFLARRLHSETVFYLNPQETIRILRSPAASLSLIENTLHLLNQVASDFPFVDGMERYERGVRSGQYKIRKDFEDVVPIFNQLNRNIEEALGWLYQDSLL